MKQIIAFLILVSIFQTSAFHATEIDWNIDAMRDHHQKNRGPLHMFFNEDLIFKCSSKLPSEVSGEMDIYRSIDYQDYMNCDARNTSIYLTTINCGPNAKENFVVFNPIKALHEGSDSWLLGFLRNDSRQDSEPVGGSCLSHKTKLIIHQCERLPGKNCSLKSCPPFLGLWHYEEIKAKQLSASSQLDDKHSAAHGRMDWKSHRYSIVNTSWCAAPSFDLGAQYLQVDLLSVHTLSAVSTQGAWHELSWVSRYLIHYSLDGVEWIMVAGKDRKFKEFEGNINSKSFKYNWLEPHVHARFVRFVPLRWVGQRCMRIELLGCKEAPSVKQLKMSLKGEPRTCEAAFCVRIPNTICVMYNDVKQCKCIQTCPPDDDKSVCGTDAVTYKNECEMKQKACESKKLIEVHKLGPCPAPLACGKFCPMPYSRCVNRQLGKKEQCECVRHCSYLIEPVCGSDKVTYDNVCLLRKTACEKKKEIMVINKGSCREKSHGKCPSPWSGSTVKRACPFAADECQNHDECPPVMKCCHDGCRKVCVKPAQEIDVLPYSQCKVDRMSGEVHCACVEMCGFNYSPVCGTDGITYSNECNLKLVACQDKKKTLAIEKQGECDNKAKLTVLAQVVWDIKNPVFKSSGIVFIRPGVVLPIACPQQTELIKHTQTKFKGVFLVSRKDYDICDMSRGKLILDCQTSNATRRKEVKAGKVFVHGQTRYLLACTDPSQNKHQGKHGPKCEPHHHMKLAVHVCCTPHDTGCDVCSLPLGVEDGRIPDSKITSSSHLDEKHAAKFARLHDNVVTANPKTTWCAKKTLDPTEYLTVDLQYQSLVSAVAVQDVTEAPGWVNKYELHYSISGKKWYKAGKKDAVFKGIKTRGSIVRHWLKPRVYARYIRFVPTEWTKHRCMRVEVYGCTVERKGSMEAFSRGSGADKLGSEVYYRTEKMQDVNTGMCGDHLCPRYSKCETVDQHLKCVCPKCSKEGEKVCGSDGHTYKDICHLQRKACKNNVAIKTVKNGSCAEKTKSPGNPSNDLCDGQKCPPFAECVSQNNGTHKCVCPTCARCGIKVCGSDGNTYKDLCELMTTACTENTNLTIASAGGCAVPEAVVKTADHGRTHHSGTSASMRSLYASTIAVCVLGLLVALGMFLSQPQKRSAALKDASHRAVGTLKSINSTRETETTNTDQAKE